MTANVLTDNFKNYMLIQHDIKHAIRGERAELVKILASELQPYAQKLTEFEREYARWALDTHSRLSVRLLKQHIREVAALDRKYKQIQKEMHRKKASWSDLSAVSKEARKYPATTTQMCMLRAALRGKVHTKGMTLAEQKDLVDEQNIAPHFNLVKEE